MCGRFVLKAPPSELVTRFWLDECADFTPHYNIPPGTDIPVIRQSPEGKRVLRLLRWGLVPHWAKDPSIGAKLNNARGESVAEKPSFRDAFKRRRCLVPTNGFYEWKAEGKIKQPYYISPKDGQPIAMFPKGEIGRLLALMQEMDHNGLRPMLNPLRKKPS